MKKSHKKKTYGQALQVEALMHDIIYRCLHAKPARTLRFFIYSMNLQLNIFVIITCLLNYFLRDTLLNVWTVNRLINYCCWRMRITILFIMRFRNRCKTQLIYLSISSVALLYWEPWEFSFDVESFCLVGYFVIRSTLSCIL